MVCVQFSGSLKLVDLEMVAVIKTWRHLLKPALLCLN